MSDNPQPTSPPPRKLVPADPKALAFATDIDRRTCHRTVPLQVLCLGLSRTGTASIRQALIDLGYSECYHYSAALQENPRDVIMWVEALEAKFEGKGKPFERKDWDQLLGHCRAITDNPAIMFYKELLESYPEAKVILSVRDSAELWWSSYASTIRKYFDAVKPPTFFGQVIARILHAFGPSETDISKALNRLFELQMKYHPYVTRDDQKAIKYYKWYNEEIQRLVPKENLLIFNVKQGWAPLCAYLGKKVPSWQFPRSNDRQLFQSNVAIFQDQFLKIVLWNMAKTFVTVGGAAGIAAWVLRRLQR